MSTFQKRLKSMLLCFYDVVTIMVVAAFFAVMVGMALSEPAVTMSNRFKTLHCTFAGDAAHVHNEDCYDSWGNLVCPLEEKLPHKHNASCYDAAGNLVCGLEETTEVHIHGAGCFEEATTEDLLGQAVDISNQVFHGEITEQDTTLVEVFAHAPAGSLPDDATMRVELIDGEAVRDVVREAVAESSNNTETVADMVATDIAFFDAAGTEIEPRDAITVMIDSDLAKDAENYRVVHVSDEGVADMVETLDATEIADRNISLSAGEVVFERDDFSTYVLVETRPMVDEEGTESEEGEDTTESEGIEDTETTESGEVDEGATDEETGTESGEDETTESADEEPTDSETEPQTESEEEPATESETGEETESPDDATTDAETEPAAEAAEPAFPAQRFEATSRNVSVVVHAPEGAFPAGTRMHVAPVDSSDVEGSIQDAVEGSLLQVVAVDITFVDKDGNDIQPLVPISVTMTNQAALDLGEPQVVHVDNEGSASVVEQTLVTSATDEVVFAADQFSVYAMVVTTLKGTLTAGDGRTYTVTAEYDENAHIPANSELVVTELPEDSEEYEAAADQAIRMLSDENGVAVINQMRLFDISIRSGEKELEPATPVRVVVEYNEGVPTEADANLEVIHFANDDEPRVLQAQVAGEGTEQLTSFQFETDSFSDFAFVQAKYIGSLDGQQFAVVRENGNLAAVTSTNHPTVADRVSGIWVNELTKGVLSAVTSAKGTKRSNEHITVWTFEHVRDNCYYMLSDDGLYLNVNGTKASVSAEPCLLEIVPQVTKTNYPFNGKVFIRSAEDPTYYLNLKGGQAPNGFQGSTSMDNNCMFLLYAANELEEDAVTTARKMSVQELLPGQNVVIYQRILNNTTDKYEIYCIDGEGKLVYAYDEGDYIGYRGDASTSWYVIEHIDEATGLPNGYFDFQNTETGAYLAPQATSALSNEPFGVVLPGKSANAANTQIEGWDKSQWTYYGYNLDVSTRTIRTGSGSDSAEFSFALPEDIEEGVLHEIDTVDSAAAGITIEMYNFPSRSMMNLFGNDTWYQNGTFKQGLLNRRLGADGLPVSKNGTSFSKIYNSTYYRGNANHLFLKSIYDGTGYYEYNSLLNYAHYDESTGNFTVYDEAGIPKNGVGGEVSSFMRGNYLPYNTIDPTRPGTNKKYFQSGNNPTDLEDPLFGGELYLTDTPDYYFGTIVTANFSQAQSGTDLYGNPIRYEFNGDDDLWVFIDGVLVLDIGGIHGSVPGSIDFSTGQVVAGEVAGSVYTTTLKQCFKDAGIFPDGTSWNDSLVDNYFTGDTFIDYSGHQMKMFYQERGAGASTLKVNFNLPVIERGTFAVEKQLGGTDQQGYTSVQFAYQAFLMVDGEPVAIRPGMVIDENGHVLDPSEASPEQTENAIRVYYEATGAPVDFYDNVTIGENEHDDVFYLKPSEAAVFAGIPEGVPYYVQEIDVSGAYFETVMINEANMGEEDGKIPEGTSIVATSSPKTILQRQRVLFRNQCSPANLRDLRITKQVVNPIDDGATFEFRVMLEGADGNLTYYNRGDYYVTKQVDGEEHYFTHVNGVLTDQGTEPVVCSQSGAWGTIAGIPDGYTVVIRGLLVGTDFYVEEIRNPLGYVQVGKELTPGSYDEGNVAGSDGAIKLRTDTQMTITNRRYSTISATKKWDCLESISGHGEVTLGLFVETADGLVLAQKGGALISEPLQVLTWPNAAATWYFDLPAGASLEGYVVREVADVDGTLVPVEPGGSVTIAGETLRTGDTATHVYLVSYEQGELKTTAGEPLVQDRADAVTNTQVLSQKVSFKKVDVASPLDSQLAGAVFDLYRVVEGEDNVLVYEALTSGDDGMLASAEGETVFELPTGTYLLRETTPPAGYLLKETDVEVLVTDSNVAYDDHTSISADGRGKSFDPITQAYVLRVTNTAGVELPHTGGAGTGAFYLVGALFVVLGAAMAAAKARRREA